MVRTPKLDQLGRAYSEMSPLNPPLSAHSTATTSSAGHERHDSGGYGSIFPFGFFRNSFGRSGNSMQVGNKTIHSHRRRRSTRHMFRCLTAVCARRSYQICVIQIYIYRETYLCGQLFVCILIIILLRTTVQIDSVRALCPYTFVYISFYLFLSILLFISTYLYLLNLFRVIMSYFICILSL